MDERDLAIREVCTNEVCSFCVQVVAQQEFAISKVLLYQSGWCARIDHAKDAGSVPFCLLFPFFALLAVHLAESVPLRQNAGESRLRMRVVHTIERLCRVE